MRKSSHAKPTLVIRLAQQRKATATAASQMRTVAKAYILPGDSSTSRTEAITNAFFINTDENLSK